MKKIIVTDDCGTEIYSRPLRPDDNKESRMWLLDFISSDTGIPVSCLKIKVRKEERNENVGTRA